MTSNVFTVEAVFENGVLRPMQPLPLASRQHVTVTVRVPEASGVWPEDVASIYQEIAAEDRRLAEAMVTNVRETWPASEERP